MNKCEYCKGDTKIDDRGNCSACGALKTIVVRFTESKEAYKVLIPNITELTEYPVRKYPVSDIPVCEST